MSEEQHGSEENGGIRINKFLASCGIDSRRVADRLIEEGRVEVNGKVIDTPGMKVTDKDFVKVDGRHMTPMEEAPIQDYLISSNSLRACITARAFALSFFR